MIEEKPGYVCFVQYGDPSISYPFDEFENKNVDEIIKKLQCENQYLCIHTPLYIKPLQSDSLPLKTHQSLKTLNKAKQYERPPFFLTFDKENNFISICITVRNKSTFEIPPFYVRFEISNLAQMTAADVKNKIVSNLGLGTNSASICFEDQIEISDNECGQSVIEKAETQNLYLDVNIIDNSLTKMRKRTYILAEIISTEKTYINDLTIIMDKWEPGLASLFSSDDFNVIFKDISVILSCHKSFLGDLEKAGSNYSSQVAVPFIEFSNFFKVSQQYIANYPSLTDVLNKYDKNKKIFLKMREIADSIDGRDLRSYLITPVQRMPRYVLFLRDLLNSTAISHPDQEFLSIAFEGIAEVTKKIDKAAEISKRQQQLMALQKKITNFTFLDKQRNLVLQTPIKIGLSTPKKGEILVFEDILVIIKEGRKAIFDSPVHKFPYRAQHPGNLSITVDSSNKKYVVDSHRMKNDFNYTITFLTIESMRYFFEEVLKLQTKLRLLYGNSYDFEWSPLLLQIPLPGVVQPFISVFEDSLMLLSTKKIPEIYRVFNQNGVICQTDVKFPTIKMPTTATVRRNKLYLVNGGSLFQYDPKVNKLTDLLTTFHPRTGHSAIFCHENLVIFGGRSTLTNQLLNDIIIYNVNKNSITSINPSKDTPLPRCHHCSFIYNEKLYIFGGETEKGISNDFYFYDLESDYWCEIDCPALVPRKSGKTIITSHYVVFIGGTPETNIQIYNIRKREVFSCQSFGNVPECLKAFDAVFASDGVIYAISEQNLYEINTPPVLKKLTISSNNLHRQKDNESDSYIVKKKKNRTKKLPGGTLKKEDEQYCMRSTSAAVFELGSDEDEEMRINRQEKLLSDQRIRHKKKIPYPKMQNKLAKNDNTKSNNDLDDNPEDFKFDMVTNRAVEQSDNEEEDERSYVSLEICDASFDLDDSISSLDNQQLKILQNGSLSPKIDLDVDENLSVDVSNDNVETQGKGAGLFALIATAAVSAVLTTGAVMMYYRRNKQ